MPSYKVITGDNALLDFDSVDRGSGIVSPAKSDVEAQARIGATTEGAAGSDTATSGLNGLLKRLLARFTTLLSVLPASLENGRFRVAARSFFVEAQVTTSTVTTTPTTISTNIDCRGYNRLSLQIENTGANALGVIEIYISPTFINPIFTLRFSSVSGDFNTANTGLGSNNSLRKILAASSNIATIAAASNGWLELNVSCLAFLAVVIRTASGTTSTRVSYVLSNT